MRFVFSESFGKQRKIFVDSRLKGIAVSVHVRRDRTIDSPSLCFESYVCMHGLRNVNTQVLCRMSAFVMARDFSPNVSSEILIRDECLFVYWTQETKKDRPKYGSSVR